MQNESDEFLGELRAIAASKLGRYNQSNNIDDVVQQSYSEVLEKRQNPDARMEDLLVLQAVKIANRMRKAFDRCYHREWSLDAPLLDPGNGEESWSLKDLIPAPAEPPDSGLLNAEILQDALGIVDSFSGRGLISSAEKTELFKRVVEKYLIEETPSFAAAWKGTTKNGTVLGRSEAAKLWRAVREVLELRHAYLCGRKGPVRVDIRRAKNPRRS